MIELDADQKTPLYEQLYAALADEIRRRMRTPLCKISSTGEIEQRFRLN